jgi:DNA-binding MarR family transcriptional regulator
MSSVANREADARIRRRLGTSVKTALRELNLQISLLNHRVGGRLDLRDVDLDCLDLVAQFGPLIPSALARRAGLHPATLTGILDRLERGGWIARERDTEDRRSVVIRALRDRSGEVFRLYAGMNSSMDGIIEGYTEAELELIADFLRRTAAAGQSAVDDLTDLADIADSR